MRVCTSNVITIEDEGGINILKCEKTRRIKGCETLTKRDHFVCLSPGIKYAQEPSYSLYTLFSYSITVIA